MDENSPTTTTDADTLASVAETVERVSQFTALVRDRLASGVPVSDELWTIIDRLDAEVVEIRRLLAEDEAIHGSR